MKQPWTETKENLFTTYQTDAHGLSGGEAQKRLAQYGENKLIEGKRAARICGAVCGFTGGNSADCGNHFRADGRLGRHDCYYCGADSECDSWNGAAF